MSILWRYIIREYLKIFFLTFFALLTIFIIISLFELLTDALEHNADTSSIIKYLIMKIPQAVHFMAPVVILISTILCIGALSRSNEITVMKAGGIGIAKIVSPIFTVSFIVCCGIFANGELVLPYANEQMERILKEDIKKEARRGVQKRGNLWFRSDDGSIWKIGLLGNDAKSLRNVSLLQFSNERIIKRRIDSKKIEWNGVEYQFIDTWVRSFYENGDFTTEHVDMKSFSIKETPEDFISLRKDPDKMSYREMRYYIKKIKREGLDPTKYIVDMEAKLSFPFISIVMTLIAIPFSLRTGRQGGASLGVGIGVATGFSVWFIYSLTLSLGRSGKIPPLTAAWGPELIIALLCMFMITKSRN